MINPKTSYQQTAPLQYINKIDSLKEIGEYIKCWGDNVLISGGKKALESSLGMLIPGLNKDNIKWHKHEFVGECSIEKIDTITKKAKKEKVDIIIGVGGGKAIDSAKVAAENANCRMVALPTIAATCAATSSISIIYDEKGTFDKAYYLKEHPSLVIIEPQIIAEAPVKYLKSGIIDSISKWYEGRAVIEGIENPDIFSLSAIKLAKLLNEKQNDDANKAIEYCNKNIANEILINVIDLNIYLTGLIQSLGQKTCRGAAAHAIHNGLTVINKSHQILHGYKVAYGILVQLFLEKKEKNEIDSFINFSKNIGITPTLNGLGVQFNSKLLKNIAQKALIDEVMFNMPWEVEQDELLESMRKAEIYIKE